MWKMKVTITPILICTLVADTEVLLKRLEDMENKRTSGDHPNDYIIENGENTEKNPGDLRRLALTQTSLKDHQQTLT